MKTHSWTTRNYATNSTNPNASYQAFRCSWLFSTGMGNTNRYIGSMQVRVPAYGNGSHEVKLAGYALGNSEGSSYYSDTSSVCEQSNFSYGDCWFAFDSFSQTRKKNVLAYGVYVNAEKGYSNIGASRGDARIECVSYQGVITPTGQTLTSGTVARYTKYRLQWTTDAEDDFERRNSTCKIIITDQDGGNSQTYTLSNGATSFDLDTTAWSSGSGIRWRVQVGAYGSGTVAESATYSLSLADPTAKVDDLRPTSKTYYGFNAVFSWAFTGSIASGAISGALQQGSAVLQYRTDNMADPADFASVSDGTNNADNSYQADAGTFSSGVIYWRVRTKNTDGAFGSYSGAAIFAIRRAPVAPVISYYDNKPLAKMRWQAKEQDGYEVAVDGISLGVRYGTGKEWQSDAVLTDGKHTLQVRIYNTYGDVSPWSSCKINVQNQPGAALAVYAEERWGEVLLCWGADNGYILRDGELITKEEGGTYTDRTSAAAHQYIVRVFDAEGYYTDSAPVLAAPSVPYAAIGLRDGTDWLAMKYATSYQNYSKAVSLGGSYQQYWGKERPVWHDAGNRVVTHTISHACKREEELLVLRSLAGQEVIYKDRDGHLAIGVFKDLQESREHGCTALSFSITETQQEAVKYDPV